MHKVSIPDHVIERGRQMRGRPRIFDRLDMSRVAHVIVDLQVGFVAPGAAVEVPETRDILANVNAVSRAVRTAGGRNVFLRYTYDPAEPQAWDPWFRNYMDEVHLARMKEAFARGAPQWQLTPELEVEATDLVIDKTRFSALIPGTCTMDEALKAHGVDTLVISGTLTNCCCESTARDALQMGYNVVFLTDANATLSDEEHNATLISMAAIFAEVLDTADFLRLVERSGARAAA